ncbi:hypothetical protein cypCar_00028515 [Cyprinus carpio]|nr:hypothetical protein cypCar_00028515 [Cyprinus carpio]
MDEAAVEPTLVQTLAMSAVKGRYLTLSPSFQRCSLASWIKENIKKKECCFYVEDGREGICKCGYPKIQHCDEAIKPEDYMGEQWDTHRHVREVPTDAFGDITFGGLGQKTGKYVRVSSDISSESLYQLMTEHWKLRSPNLLISVTGGAKNFYMKTHLKDKFRRGLIKVAQTTGAWILTGGTHAGVMKHVGMAVRDYTLSSGLMEGQIVVIGVAPWGVIHNRHTLVHPETIYNAMLKHTPCVVLEGSGRLADVIAQVAALPLSKVTLVLISQLMKRFFGQEYQSFTEVQVIEWTKKIQDIIRMPHLLTVFRIDEDKNYDVDVAILQALLKASRSDEHAGRQSWERQLELAVAWNRVDIAESEIFTEESQWTSCDLHPAMFSALVGDKPEFVRLLLENGVCVGKFLEQEDKLTELYAHLPACFFLRKLAKRVQGGKIHRGQEPQPGSSKISLSHVAEEVPSKGLVDLPCLGEEWTPDTVWDPGRDLFLWAVVQNNTELAEIGWEQIASNPNLPTYSGVFSECHSWDAQRAQKLLIRVSPSWGRSTCLWLALEADAKSFIAHSGVQALLTQIWCGELSVDNPHWKVLLCMIFFPLIYTGFLIFRRDEDIQRQAERTEQQKLAMDAVFSGSSDAKAKRHYRGSSQKPELEPLNCSSRLMSLFTSPQVKFYWNIASYFGFLWLFAVVLMIDFQAYPSWRELLLYVWLTSLVCEEFRQASGTVFYVGKVVLCIDFIIFSLRLMAIFTISRTLGPKIIIVRRMMMDLFFFMFLLSIWVVAYGVAKQGILIHNEERLNWIIRGAVYEPYLIIFGNVPTNIDNTQFDMASCSVNGSDPLKPKCPMLNDENMPAFPEWLTIIMLCVYLLFANILLLNLLIAIFNYTFQEVQDNTDTIWKFQRYELIKEYHSRPALPPPFILLSHLILFIRAVLLRYPPQRHKTFRQELEQTEEEELLSWEAYMKDNYLASTRQDESQSVEHQGRSSDRDDGESSGQETDEEAAPHTFARQLQYPCSTVKRFPVPEEKVPWEVNFTPYLPPVYNEQDSSDSDTSVLDKHRNPGGRTGIRGKGALKSLGPNHILHPVLTRWRDAEHKVLEFLAVWEEAEKHWALPGCSSKPDEPLAQTLEKILGKKLHDKTKSKLEAGEEVYKGYVDDSRNTDNAWIETTIVTLHCDKHTPLMADLNRIDCRGQVFDILHVLCDGQFTLTEINIFQ